MVQFLEKERLIQAEWADKSTSYKIVNLFLTATQSDDFIAKLTFTISNMQYNILGLDTKNVSDKIICNIKLKVTNNDNLSKLEKALKNLNNVLEVVIK